MDVNGPQNSRYSLYFFLPFCRLGGRIASLAAAAHATHPGKAPPPPLDCGQRAAYGAISCWANLMTSWTASAANGTFALPDLKALLELTDGFAAVAEVHAGRSISVLRGRIQEACRATLECMHAANMRIMTGGWTAAQPNCGLIEDLITPLLETHPFFSVAAASLERDKWAYAPISAAAMQCMEQLAARSAGSPAPPGTSASANGSAVQQMLSMLSIGGQQYHAVETVQVLLGLLQQYIALCDTAPAFTSDVSQRVVELLRTFNSRTCQLILGAGAMQVGWLLSFCWLLLHGVLFSNNTIQLSYSPPLPS